MSKYFYIQSRLCPHFVLTIDGFKKGGNLVMYPEYGGANQLWKWGPDDTLVSKMGLVADVKGSSHKRGTHCIGYYPTGKGNQRWTYDESTGLIRSTMSNLVMDISGGDAKISNFVITYDQRTSANQRWNLVYPN